VKLALVLGLPAVAAALPGVAGRRLALRGVLDYRPPGRAWLRIALAAVLAAVASVAATRSTPVTVGLALVAVPFVWAIRVGRGLYGRPDVPVVGWIGIAITCLVGAALLYGLLSRDDGTRVLTAFLAGFGALYEGLTMLPVLTHAIALSTLPTAFVRVAEVLILGAGIGALAGSVLGHMREPTTETV
jgi:hypothetical protein